MSKPISDGTDALVALFGLVDAMPSDIVERLRGVKHNSLADMTHEAADEIDRFRDAFAAWKKEREMLRASIDVVIKQRNAYREALERIANEDYRGNRSAESQIAFDALAAGLKGCGNA